MTAVEWLVEQLKINNYISDNAHWLIDEAKEMEKEQEQKQDKNKIMKVNLMWDWTDFGIMLRVFKNSKHGDYHISIDIQIAWLNIWIETFKKK